eukprot:COSAG02_NODE_2518_length_8611_cov_1282.272560_3_plen_184_part_00
MSLVDPGQVDGFGARGSGDGADEPWKPRRQDRASGDRRNESLTTVGWSNGPLQQVLRFRLANDVLVSVTIVVRDSRAKSERRVSKYVRVRIHCLASEPFPGPIHTVHIAPVRLSRDRPSSGVNWYTRTASSAVSPDRSLSIIASGEACLDRTTGGTGEQMPLTMMPRAGQVPASSRFVYHRPS